MAAFFDQAIESTQVEHGAARFSLPIRYFRDDAFSLYFSADAEAVRALLPSDALHPVMVRRGRAALAVVAFNYIDTTIGAYGEVGVAAPVVHGSRPLPLLPAVFESGYDGFGALVLHLPVTHQVARDAGRGQWGYTKFVADMDFELSPERLRCRLSEGPAHILTLTVSRGGMFARDKKPLVTYSVKDDCLIKTVIPQLGSYRFSPRPQGCGLELGDHPVARSIAALDPSPEPLLKRYYLERSAILPAGTVAERGVRALDGYRGQDGNGALTVRYPNGGR